MVGISQDYHNAWSGAPSSDSAGDLLAVTLALRMQTSVAGKVVGVRFFRDLSDGGEHVGLLYAATDLSIQDVCLFHKNTAAAAGPGSWQSAYFRKTHHYAAGDRFVVGVHFSAGNYWLTPAGLATAVVNANLTITAQGDGGDNGLFGYSTLQPVSTFNSSQYGVDVIFLEDR